MIRLFRGIIPWQNSLNENRNILKFWLRISPGYLGNSIVYSSLNLVLNPLLGLGGYLDDHIFIRSVDELYEKLEIVKGNGPGDYIKFNIGNLSLEPFLSVASGVSRPFDSLSLQVPIQYFHLDEAMQIVENVPSGNFHSAYLVDSEYIDLQKQVDKTQYIYTGGLRKDKSWNDKNRVLVNGRPGRKAALPGKDGHLETGAAHFWFGDLIYKDIPKERILSFGQAHEIRELPNGIIYVNLYEDTFNGNLPENQVKQEAFKEHLGLIQKS